MKLNLKFSYKSGLKDSVDISVDSDIYSFKSDYQYVYLGNDTFEMIMYDKGFPGGHDYVAYYSQTDDIPIFSSPRTLPGMGWGSKKSKCTCGKDTAKDLGKHSFWCDISK